MDIARIEIVVDDLVKWLKTKVKEARAEGLVFGLSGGVDSAVMAGLAKLAFPDTALGIIMPCHSNPVDEEHGLLVAKSLDLKTKKVDLTDTFNNFIKTTDLDINNKMAIANIKPRLRMTTLYYFAQSMNLLVAGPTNKSEFVTGYFTKFGDSGVDLLPLADFVKEEIWDIARYLNIPDLIIDKVPTAGLWDNQTDEEEMGFRYDELDKFIKTKEGRKELKNRIEKMYNKSAHKREYPPIYKYNNK